jgi:hypothetical protein
MQDAFERERDALAHERGAWSAFRYTLAAYLDLIHASGYERLRLHPWRRRDAWLTGIVLDVSYGLRALRRAPVFSGIAISCLAVGIAVNAAAFSVLDALLMRDFPGVERQKELSTILISYEMEWGRTSPGQMSTLDWELFRDRMSVFTRSGVMGTASVAPRLSGGALAVCLEFANAGGKLKIRCPQGLVSSSLTPGMR